MERKGPGSVNSDGEIRKSNLYVLIPPPAINSPFLHFFSSLPTVQPPFKEICVCGWIKEEGKDVGEAREREERRDSVQQFNTKLQKNKRLWNSGCEGEGRIAIELTQMRMMMVFRCQKYSRMLLCV